MDRSYRLRHLPEEQAPQTAYSHTASAELAEKQTWNQMPEPVNYLDPARRHTTVLASALLKANCTDFRVEERPSYQLSGEGEHLFLWVQKQDVSAGHLLKILSQKLKISQRDIGVAGQKDRRAVTQQYVSVPASCAAKVSLFQDQQIQILNVIAHGNKLRTGHLKGNRFQIHLRSIGKAFEAKDCDLVNERLSQLTDTGFPNYYGPQRFGQAAASVTKGVQLLTGTAKEKKAVRASRFERKMWLSAVQSAVFNTVTSVRVQQGTVGAPIEGDVVCRRDGIRPFLYSNHNSDDTAQLLPMGPMPGLKMVPSEASVLIAEKDAVQSLGLTCEHFDNKKDTPGARRPMLAWPSDCSCTLTSSGSLLLRFDLLAGCYATVLLRELVQTIHTGPVS